jgi:hypothetical protein
MEGNFHASRAWKGDMFWHKKPTSNTDVGFFSEPINPSFLGTFFTKEKGGMLMK